MASSREVKINTEMKVYLSNALTILQTLMIGFLTVNQSAAVSIPCKGKQANSNLP